ncbi:MAG: glycosyltransferase family 4 protein, partial [Candidatus Subteraquimicrobiales bacterium]|nr:glycosyltransferase family 4 protein [Candidatus Subteraquimicrobiales bacterium]
YRLPTTNYRLVRLWRKEEFWLSANDGSEGMRVLLISNMYPSKDSPNFGIFIKEQVDTLKQKGVNFTLVVNTIKKGGWVSLFKYLLLFIKVIKASFYDFDLIHYHYLFPNGLLALIPYVLRRKPLIATAHGSDVNLVAKVGWIKRLNSLVFKHLSILICVSEDLASELQQVFQINPKKVLVVDCGVDTDIFKPEDKNRLRNLIGLSPSQKIVLYVGNLVLVKGVNYLIEALPEIIKKHPEVYLVLIGSGPALKDLQREVVALNLEDYVRFEGAKPHWQIPRWMGAADVFVLPSEREGFGLVALEAMACGVPVVASKVGGLTEFIEDGKDGFLINSGDKNALVEKINYLLTNFKAYESISSAAREKALRYDIGIKAEKIKEIYEKVRRKELVR